MTLSVLIVTPWFPNHSTDQSGNFIFHSAEALLEAGAVVSVLVCRPWVPRIFGIFHSDWIRPSLRRDLFDPNLNIGLAHYFSLPRSCCSELFGPFVRLTARAAIQKIVSRKGIRLIHAHTEAIAHGIWGEEQ